ncbi:uncharacterized protein LOC120263028 [Dioscorea cayenensis subsp. rotundata]|uniref:Uncharacterized protein LOC120263028 n=1 Tax=Dioscorea cayennensis subsp. rotundata TaxID=55577 RepID=A0AB40BKI9_DIOCR|nr:uncharacterized protein LOC120263028 [Dioscorea cayenensis subsp. rotundata]
MASAAAPAGEGVEMVACGCCGIKEECTVEYIAKMKARHGGKWVCGLCDEAVKEEARRAGRRISKEEALERHTSFIEAFRTATAAARSDSGDDRLVAVMRQLLRRSIDSPRSVAIQSTPRSPRRKADDGGSKAAALSRSKSCFPTLAQ